MRIRKVGRWKIPYILKTKINLENRKQRNKKAVVKFLLTLESTVCFLPMISNTEILLRCGAACMHNADKRVFLCLVPMVQHEHKPFSNSHFLWKQGFHNAKSRKIRREAAQKSSAGNFTASKVFLQSPHAIANIR